MTTKRALLSYGLITIISLSVSLNAFADVAASYLAKDAPTFNQTLNQFEQDYNRTHSGQMLASYQEVAELAETDSLFFVSKINDSLYSSVVVDSDSRKIKTVQMTYLPLTPDSEQKEPAAEDITPIDGSTIVINGSALGYMTNLIKWFNPRLSQDECESEALRLLKTGRNGPLYQEISNNLRYVVVDRGEKGITLAVEPIKQPTPELTASE